MKNDSTARHNNQKCKLKEITFPNFREYVKSPRRAILRGFLCLKHTYCAGTLHIEEWRYTVISRKNKENIQRTMHTYIDKNSVKILDFDGISIIHFRFLICFL